MRTITLLLHILIAPCQPQTIERDVPTDANGLEIVFRAISSTLSTPMEIAHHYAFVYILIAPCQPQTTERDVLTDA